MSNCDVTPVDIHAEHRYDGHNFDNLSFFSVLLVDRFVCYFSSIFAQTLFS
jgi:hypothetical protein